MENSVSHDLKRAVSRASMGDSPCTSSGVGELTELRRQLRETADDNKTMLVELVEMRREMNSLLQEAIKEQQSNLQLFKSGHPPTEGMY